MPASALAESPPRHVPRRLERVMALTRLEEVRAAWEALLAVAPASAYQTPGWLYAWLAAQDRDVDPLFVVGSDDIGPVALLPLRRTRRGGAAIARFAGGRDANIGLGLFHPDVSWDARILRRLLGEAARLGRLDLFWLANQPDALGGRRNPMLVLPASPSPSRQHEALLDAAPEVFLARTLSARARKHIRQKDAKLAAIAPVCHQHAHDRASAERIVDALLAQRRARLGDLDDERLLRAFLLAAGARDDGEEPAVELHALRCGDDIVATFAGTGHAGRFSGMLLSFANDAAWARFSPGELLLARIVAQKCREGFRVFDLGVGEARYKSAFCPIEVALYDTVIGITLSGRAAARMLRAWLATKRRVKQSPRLWAAIGGLRALRRRVSGRLAA